MRIYFYKEVKGQFDCKLKSCFYFSKYRGIIFYKGYGIGIDYNGLINFLR